MTTAPWRPQDEVPSWLDPDERDLFWAQVQSDLRRDLWRRPEPDEELIVGSLRYEVAQVWAAFDDVMRAIDSLPWYSRWPMRAAMAWSRWRAGMRR